MRLSTLLSSLASCEYHGDLNLDVQGIAYDSKAVKPDDVFVAIKGFRVDGHRHLEEAFSKGATAAVTEERLSGIPGITQILVPDTRLALAQLAAAFYGNPSSRLQLIGVTGTTGKTTTAYLIESILSASGAKTGLIGTVDIKVGEKKFPVKLTTPESLDLQRLFKKMLDTGVEKVAMEVSSHAIDLQRVEACQFDALVFTNLSQDHLDYHHSLPEYFKVKRRLFEKNPESFWIVNLDDPHGKKIAKIPGGRVLTYGLSPEAEIRAESIEINRKGVLFSLVGPSLRTTIRSGLKGNFNLYNLLAAAATGIILGSKPEAIRDGLEGLKQVPGRFETVDLSQDFDVVVDFAHTPDSLEKALKAARGITTGRIITVFGCGGDRDKMKRPLMGQIAGELSDLIIITSDNPRSEEPQAIIDEIEQGLRSTSPKKYLKIIDRREAIFEAISQAKAKDLVLIAGKGHESYQIFKDKTVPFDDREIAEEAVKVKGKS